MAAPGPAWAGQAGALKQHALALKGKEAGGGKCFQKSFEEEKPLIVMRAESRQFRLSQEAESGGHSRGGPRGGLKNVPHGCWAGGLPAAALDKASPASAALTLLLGGEGVGWGSRGVVVLVAAVGHPPHSCSPRGAWAYLQIVEDEERVSRWTGAGRTHGVRVWGWHLVVVGGVGQGSRGRYCLWGQGSGPARQRARPPRLPQALTGCAPSLRGGACGARRPPPWPAGRAAPW